MHKNMKRLPYVLNTPLCVPRGPRAALALRLQPKIHHLCVCVLHGRAICTALPGSGHSRKHACDRFLQHGSPYRALVGMVGDFLCGAAVVADTPAVGRLVGCGDVRCGLLWSRCDSVIVLYLYM